MVEAQDTIQYTYDDLNRLVAVQYSDETRISYTYDAAGNRTAAKITGMDFAEVEQDVGTVEESGIGYQKTALDIILPQIEWQLSISTGPNAGASYTLKKETRLGRHPENDVIIEDLKISRRHAVIQWVDDHYRISDLGSANGTFINSERIAVPTILKNGDMITIGNTHLNLQIITTSGEDGEQPTSVGTWP
ncbi:MAG: FHA domain-containing protein [Anaerolineaceae bacterium]|nr:FHA domain-containing protein [Anaerolineaceae bacterium]